MSKGIRQFNRALLYANTNRSFSKEYKADVKAVKKYLKEREELEDKASFYEAENKRLEELVSIFKNAITIIHKPMEVKVFDTSNKAVSMLAQTLTELRANQLDIRLRDTLRKWVLENACPREYQALCLLVRTGLNVHWFLEMAKKGYRNYSFFEPKPSKAYLTEEEFNLLVEVCTCLKNLLTTNNN